MRDEKIAARIASYAEIKPTDVVLEVGAGFGNLTKYLLNAKKVYAVEIDPRLFRALQKNIKSPNVIFVNEDILEFGIPSDVNKVIGNIPYEISSPLTEMVVFDLNEKKKRGMDTLAVIMYQREFAERMVTWPGMPNYSRLTVLVNYICEVELLEYVPKGAFKPAPKVDSAIVKIVPKGIEVDKRFLHFVKLLFMHKRKFIRNALLDARQFLKVKDKKELAKILDKRIKSDERVMFCDVDKLHEYYKLLGDLLED